MTLVSLFFSQAKRAVGTLGGYNIGITCIDERVGLCIHESFRNTILTLLAFLFN